MTSVRLLQANLGGIDTRVAHAPQHFLPDRDISYAEWYWDDQNFPLRSASFTPRMQAKIPKVLGWELLDPPSDIYIWLDASFQMQEGAVAWLLSELGGEDFAIFQHPRRSSLADEVAFLRKRLTKRYVGSGYIRERYANEWLDLQVETYLEDPDFVDNRLFACGCFLYRPTPAVQALMRDWWYHITRYHINDQLSLPYVLAKSQVAVHTIHANIYKCPHLTYCRGDR